MSALHLVEVRLGHIETWPSYIIEYLFLLPSAPWVVAELCAFFCGNGIPLTLAYHLYRACNPKVHSSVRQLFEERYSIWAEHTNTLLMGTYYNMRLGQFVCLCGAAYTGPPIPVFGKPPPFLGIDNTSAPEWIRDMSDLLRLVQVS